MVLRNLTDSLTKTNNKSLQQWPQAAYETLKIWEFPKFGVFF